MLPRRFSREERGGWCGEGVTSGPPPMLRPASPLKPGDGRSELRKSCRYPKLPSELNLMDYWKLNGKISVKCLSHQ